MICEKCGKECKDNCRFCTGCGAPLQQKAGETGGRPANDTVARNNENDSGKTGSGGAWKFPGRLVLLVAGVLLIAVLYILYSILSPVIFTSREKSGFQVFNSDDSYILARDNNKIEFSKDGESNFYSRYSLDRKSAGLLINYNNDDGGELWFVKDKEKVKVSDEVRNFVISGSGNALIYFKDYDPDEETASIYRYDTAGKKSELLAKDAYCSYDYNDFNIISVSPDGKSVGYIGDYESDSDFSGYIKILGKEPEKIGRNRLCLAVSDGGRYIYSFKMDSDDQESIDLYVRSGEDETRLAENIFDNRYVTIMFNSNYSEVVFNSEGRTYISRNGQEEEKILNSETAYLLTGRDFIYNNMEGIDIYVYDIKDFSSITAINNEGTIVYTDGKGESNTVARETERHMVNRDGTELVYINRNNNLYRENLSTDDSDEKMIAEDVANFVMSRDGSIVYYVNDDEELYYVKGGGEPKKLADDVYEYSLRMSGDNTVLFLVDYSSSSENGELYYSRNGGKKVKIADEVYDIKASPSDIYYYSDYDEDSGTCNVYRSGGNMKFEKFLTEISYYGNDFPRESTALPATEE